MSYQCPAQGQQPGHLPLSMATWRSTALSRAMGGCSTLGERMLLRCAGWDLQTHKTSTLPLPKVLEMSGAGFPLH